MTAWVSDDPPGPHPSPRGVLDTETYSSSRLTNAIPGDFRDAASVPAIAVKASEQRQERARTAALARWSGTTAEQRSEAARSAAAVRWAGHAAAAKNAGRQPRACRYCGDVVPMTSRQVKCSKPDCNLDHRAARLGIR
jgi:hypothetical protein